MTHTPARLVPERMTDVALWKRAFSTLGTLRTGIEQRDGINLHKARIREIESVLHELQHRGTQFEFAPRESEGGRYPSGAYYAPPRDAEG